MGTGYTCSYAASLLACLPSESAFRRAIGDGWSDSERMLAHIEHGIRVIAWQRTADGSKGRRFPEMLPSPAKVKREIEERERYTSSYMDEVADMLGIPEDRR